MTWEHHLDTDCEELSQRLKVRMVPKANRAQARGLLSRVFALRSLERNAEQDAELQRLARKVEALVYPLDPKWSPQLLRNVTSWSPVRVRFAVSHSRIRSLHEQYLGKAERLEAIVAWFWQRCAPENEVARDLTIQEKALDEFAGEDLEFVWGRRKRPMQ